MKASIDDYRPHKFRIKVARIFNTYGPRMHLNDGRFISSFVVQALHNKDIKIYGDGLQTRSFCHIDDLVEGIVLLMDSPDQIAGPMNLGKSCEVTIRELADRISGITGSRSAIKHLVKPVDDPRQRCPDITLPRSILGWRPKVQLEEGLSRTVTYFDSLLRQS